jgi:hypothetical protein
MKKMSFCDCGPRPQISGQEQEFPRGNHWIMKLKMSFFDMFVKRCRNNQHSDTRHNDAQYNDTQHSDTHHHDTHNYKSKCIKLCVVILSVAMLCRYTSVLLYGMSLCCMPLCWVSCCVSLYCVLLCFLPFCWVSLCRVLWIPIKMLPNG